MTNKSRQEKRKISAPIIIAIISLVGICITTAGAVIVGTFPSILNVFESNPNKVEEITFRVTEINGISVPMAKVILLAGNDIHIQYTDSNGTSVFNIIKTETLRVFVETDQYEIYDQIFSSSTSNPIEIRLSPKDISRKSIIVRVIDNKDDMPINGAEVILVANGSIYSQTTDSNGITKFITEFPADEIEGDISVSVSGFKSEHQKVTLQADRIQDIRLDKDSSTLTVSYIGQVEEITKSPKSSAESITSDTDSEITYDCSSKSLSPEEIVNCGNHQYQYTRALIFGDGCSIKEGTSLEGQEFIVIGFSKNGDKMSLGSVIFSKNNVNTYQETASKFTDTQNIVTFNENGYIWDSNAIDTTNGNIQCTVRTEYSLITP